MAVKDGEPLELCEQCGSPLEDGFCRSCGVGFREGASPVGSAPLDRRELSRVLGRSVGQRAHGSYALSMQQEEGLAPLRKEIQSLVEQFSASPETKNSVKQNAEHIAVKLLSELGPTDAAIASVAQEFMNLGRNVLDVSLCISRVHPKMGRLKDLVVEVYPLSPDVSVLINGREVEFKSHSNEPYRRLRIPIFVTDGGATVELKNAQLTKSGYDDRRVKPLGASTFVLKADERNFELFKVLKEARLSGALAQGGVDQKAIFRKYSISKLPLTEWLLREVGLLQGVSTEYARRCAEKVKNGHGRSPRKLAEEALVEACNDVVSPTLCKLFFRKFHLKESAMRSLVVKSELDAWQS
jgi:hypothetical protein